MSNLHIGHVLVAQDALRDAVRGSPETEPPDPGAVHDIAVIAGRVSLLLLTHDRHRRTIHRDIILMLARAVYLHNKEDQQ
jgi:hypothetical protein